MNFFLSTVIVVYIGYNLYKTIFLSNKVGLMYGVSVEVRVGVEINETRTCVPIFHVFHNSINCRTK